MLAGAGAILLPACRSGGSGTSANAQAGTSLPANTVNTAATAGTTATTVAAAGDAAAPSCVVKPELTEGPYYVDEKLNRADIRSDPSDGSVRPGSPLTLTFRVSSVASGGCKALPQAVVDVWHCDASGAYSDVAANQTVGKKFLRGYQATDANGVATFTTIYPGSYQGRAVHIHVKIRTGNKTFTSQLFFDDAFTDKVYAHAPYTTSARTRNSSDSIFRDSNNLLTLDVRPDGPGYASTFDIGMQL